MFRFVEMFCLMLTNVSALNIKPTWLYVIKIWMACGIRKQTAPFLKNSRLCVGAPIQCGQYGDRKATAVRTTIYNYLVRKVIIFIFVYAFFYYCIFEILRIYLVCSHTSLSWRPALYGDGFCFPPNLQQPTELHHRID